VEIEIMLGIIARRVDLLDREVAHLKDDLMPATRA
jgi:hypothetical protein